MAFDSRHSSTHSWTAPHVWGTAPPKSPTEGYVSSFLGQEYTPPAPKSRMRSHTVMNPFSSHHHQPPTALPQIDEERPQQKQHDSSQRTYPTLNEVLHNTAAPPYTLSSFMAYLSTMHSLET